MQLLSFISQCLLCVIFRQLGTKKKRSATRIFRRDSSIVVTEGGDEELDAQTRTWLLFLKEREGWKMQKPKEYDEEPGLNHETEESQSLHLRNSSVDDATD